MEPGQEVEVNQNPGSWWRVNGRQAFAGQRVAEMTVPFVARADETGRLVLEVRPVGLEIGYGLHLAGVILLALSGWLAWSRTNRAGRVPWRAGLDPE